MKGLVFTELLEMAETVLSEDDIDEIIEKASLTSGGAYTRVGDYSCQELLTLVEAFGVRLELPSEDLQQRFGHWVFKSFGKSLSEFLAGRKGTVEMLEAIDGEVYVEVRKLYPDAEFSRFETCRRDGNRFIMRYCSDRRVNYFCMGLIKTRLAHFGEKVKISLMDCTQKEPGVAEFFERAGIVSHVP